MSNKSKIISACALIFIVICSLVIIIANRRHSNTIAEARYQRRVLISRRNAARDLVKTGIMTPDETVRFQAITTGVLQNHAISDADLDWMLLLLNKPEPSPELSTQLRYIDLGALEYVKTTTPQQQDKVFNALLPLISGNEPLGKANADLTLASFKVVKAIPYIRAQLQDPSSYVTAGAKRALKELAS